MQMEVTEFEVTKLDASLFEIPAGMTEATSGSDLAKAVSDANEVKLAARAGRGGAAEKAGMVRVAVPELLNKTTQRSTRAPCGRSSSPSWPSRRSKACRSPPRRRTSWTRRRKSWAATICSIAQITELKASKPGRLGRLVKKTAGESTEKDVTEAKLNVQLVPVGAAKPRLDDHDGNDGGIGFKTGLRLARAAAMMYLAMRARLPR